MNPTWNDPGREPPPPEWGAREDGELEALARLYRDDTPPEPAWQPTLARIESRLGEELAPRRRWRAGYLAGLVAASAAAVFAGVLVARGFWVEPPVIAPEPERVASGPAPTAEDEEPYPVALLSEVQIIRMRPDDADRIVTGQPLLGTFEFAAAEDIEIVQLEPDPEEGRVPRLRRSKGAPPIIVARTTDEDEDP
jgi:hypothetical protein